MPVSGGRLCLLHPTNCRTPGHSFYHNLRPGRNFCFFVYVAMIFNDMVLIAFGALVLSLIALIFFVNHSAALAAAAPAEKEEEVREG